MKKIYKYPIETTNVQELRLPVGAKILTLQVQGNTPCIWAQVNIHIKETEIRTLLTFGTGHELNGLNPVYIGTYQLNGGDLVFHVFETEL